MTESLASYFEMGGYARFIWPAYGLATVVLVGLLLVTLRSLRAREAELRALQDQTPGRRGRSRDSSHTS